MNVMAQAHKDCKARIAAGNPNRYADLFRVALRQAHKEYKAMQTQKTIKLADIATILEADLDATGFSLEGFVVDCDGGLVPVGEYSSQGQTIQQGASYYMNSSNGFKAQDLHVTLHGLENAKQIFKIIR